MTKMTSAQIRFTKGQRLLLKGDADFPFTVHMTVGARTTPSRGMPSLETLLVADSGTKAKAKVRLEHWNDTPAFSVCVNTPDGKMIFDLASVTRIGRCCKGCR